MKSIRFVLIVTFMSLFMLSQIGFAKTIPIVVDLNPPIKRHLKIITEAVAGDLLEVHVSDRCQSSKLTICRYVQALKNTRASVRLTYIPEMIKQFAMQCARN